MRDRRAGNQPVAVAGERGVTLVELTIAVAILAIVVAIALLVLCQDVGRGARLAADTGTVAALRSAVAVYYGKHRGTLPPDQPAVDTLVNPAPVFQCPGQACRYDPTNRMIAPWRSTSRMAADGVSVAQA
jgi:prepilin-type N-terminal cleavage/methylation domain-containing protein